MIHPYNAQCDFCSQSAIRFNIMRIGEMFKVTRTCIDHIYLRLNVIGGEYVVTDLHSIEEVETELLRRSL